MTATKRKSGGKRTGAGRPTFQPTEAHRELVKALVAVGIPHAEICLFIKRKDGAPVSHPTLYKYFKEELATGKIQATSRVAQTLYQKALEGDTTCMIFWLKTQAGWSEKQKLEVTGKDGGAIEVKTEYDLTPEELDKELQKRGLPLLPLDE